MSIWDAVVEFVRARLWIERCAPEVELTYRSGDAVPNGAHCHRCALLLLHSSCSLPRSNRLAQISFWRARRCVRGGQGGDCEASVRSAGTRRTPVESRACPVV